MYERVHHAKIKKKKKEDHRQGERRRCPRKAQPRAASPTWVKARIRQLCPQQQTAAAEHCQIPPKVAGEHPIEHIHAGCVRVRGLVQARTGAFSRRLQEPSLITLPALLHSLPNPLVVLLAVVFVQIRGFDVGGRTSVRIVEQTARGRGRCRSVICR